MTNSSAAVTPSYFRAALSNQYNVILWAGSVTFSAALASWAPLVSGLVGEALWLMVGPHLPAFRRRTDAMRAVEARSLASARPAQGEVAPEYADRAAAVSDLLAQVEQLCASRSDLSSADRLELSRRLASLMPSFLDVCATHQRLRRAATQVPLGDLQLEVASLNQALASETDLGVRASLRRGLTVAERRIKQLEGNEAACRSLELALQNFQQSLALLAEAAAGLASASEMAAEIDAAAAQLSRQVALEAERERELPGGRASTLPPAPN